MLSVCADWQLPFSFYGASFYTSSHNRHSFTEPCLLIIHSLISWERSGISVPTFAVLLGEASYVLYLIHLPILNFAVKRIDVAYHTLMILGIIGLSVLVHLFVEKPLISACIGAILKTRRKHA
jgi:peptidoglycan/LPS O-acetylase OafA/YrhL